VNCYKFKALKIIAHQKTIFTGNDGRVIEIQNSGSLNSRQSLIDYLRLCLSNVNAVN